MTISWGPASSQVVPSQAGEMGPLPPPALLFSSLVMLPQLCPLQGLALPFLLSPNPSPDSKISVLSLGKPMKQPRGQQVPVGFPHLISHPHFPVVPSLKHTKLIPQSRPLNLLFSLPETPLPHAPAIPGLR